MPETHFVGIDISREMCGYARDQVSRHGLDDRIEIFEGELSDFLGSTRPGERLLTQRRTAEFDTVVFSFSLSMIPDWWETLKLAFDAMPDGGQLMIADFGACQSWPSLARWRLYKNLSHFHDFPRPQLADCLAAQQGLEVREQRLFGGCAVVLDIVVPAAFRPSDGPSPAQPDAHWTIGSDTQGESAR